jgi:hypothetical protein
MSMTGQSDWVKNYCQEIAQHVYGLHIKATEELAAAFIARHGLDPTEATIVTDFNVETMTWTTRVERTKHGSTHDASQGGMPEVPGQWEGQDG